MHSSFWWVRRIFVSIASATIFALALSTHADPPPAIVTAGAEKMRERILAIKAATDPLDNAFLNNERAALFEKFTKRAETNSVDYVNGLLQWGLELLKAGRMEEAIPVVEEVKKVFAARPGYAAPENVKYLMTLEALSYLRLGEVENCFALHGPDSCLLPFRPGAFHKKPRGSREAIRVFNDTLEKWPDDLKFRWLLNLAHMTLGEYPQKVPAKWLIDPRVFDAEYDIKRFTNIAGPLGIEVGGLAGGVIAEDFDNDGDIDLLTSQWRAPGGMNYFRNDGAGGFDDLTEAAGLAQAIGGLNMIQADYNNDGFADVFVLRGAWEQKAGKFPNSLLKNNGDGTFSDVTEPAGMLSFHPTQAAVWFDYNNDGWIDLFIGNESLEGNLHRSELFRNNKDGTFTDVAPAFGVNLSAFVKGVTAGDYNNDGRVDLYLSRGRQPNLLLKNDGPGENGKWKFSDGTPAAGVVQPERSFPTWFFDYNNDGHLDLFVSGYFMNGMHEIAADYMGLPHNGERMKLYRNRGDGTFEDVTKEANLYKMAPTMGCNFGDLDNDGYLDFYLATGDPDLATLIPNRMFRNDAGKRFQDVTTSGGFGHLQKGHAVAWADFDADGDLDVYSVTGGAYDGDTARSVLFENPGHGGHWVELKLIGKESNRAAINARIRVIAETPAGERSIYRDVNSGGSFGSSPLRQHIGLADAKAINRVEITWPVTGKKQTIENLQLDRFYHITEGSPTAEAKTLKPVKYKVTPTPEG